MQVFDGDGNELADFEISEKQQNLLELGEEIVVLFHTPQLFRSLIGERNGAFTLRKVGDHIVAPDAGIVSKYVDMLRAVKQAREHP